MDRYNLLAKIGNGVFATIMLAESKLDQELYAIKILMKKRLIENDEVKGSKTEKSVLMKGHIKIVDFITSAEGIADHYGTTKSFCGTNEFIAPEILLDISYGRAVDWWAFGIVMYQMMAWQSPFSGEDEDEIYDAILAKDPSYPAEFPEDAVDLTRKLLVKNPEERLGYDRGAKEIMDHSFFDSTDWDALYKKDVTPPFRPAIRDRNDLSNFDTEYTSTAPDLTPEQSGMFRIPVKLIV
ncbi:uncharacterized protein KY384_007148 [Bacidia gigantensis]|uniref:uncharacterized protein n=1 Tax=Bacidia gigantensis TaxID=2732470 RepID=UPI001D052E0F|nr:uncharacterized protein KY384_007148 [Bacidia gigantensis]KAG8528231.1 hypothetical protein KY384_007148 [Bacidia gigantensis]